MLQKFFLLVTFVALSRSSNIPRDSICHIQNRQYTQSGYLYPESDAFIHDVNRRNIYAEIFNPISGYAPWCLPSSDHCKWKFEVDKGHQSSYRIKSVYYDEYLYSAAEDLKRDPDRRRSFTWIGGACNDPECYWHVEQVPGTNYYTIKNDRYEDHLYAAANDLALDHKRRSVFGWKWNGEAGVNDDKSMHWSITC